MSPNDPLLAYLLLYHHYYILVFIIVTFSSSPHLTCALHLCGFPIGFSTALHYCSTLPTDATSSMNVTVITRGPSTVAPPASLSVASVPVCLFELILYLINYSPLHYSVLPTLKALLDPCNAPDYRNYELPKETFRSNFS